MRRTWRLRAAGWRGRGSSVSGRRCCIVDVLSAFVRVARLVIGWSFGPLFLDVVAVVVDRCWYRCPARIFVEGSFGWQGAFEPLPLRAEGGIGGQCLVDDALVRQRSEVGDVKHVGQRWGRGRVKLIRQHYHRWQQQMPSGVYDRRRW